MILPSLSFSLSFSLSLFFSFFLTGPTSVALSCVSSRLNFAPKSTFHAKKKYLLCSHRHITVIAGPTCLIAHLLAPYDRAQSLTTLYPLRLNHRVHPGGPAGSENTACRLSATRAAVNPSLYKHNANYRCSAQPECFGVPVCVPPQLTPCTTTESETPSTCDCL